jgi:CHASE1-domain containing sensor protein
MHSPPRKQEDLVNRAWLPYVVLGLALTLTAIATGFVWRAVGLKDEVRFASAIHETREDILSRLNKYTDLLLSGRGFFLSVDEPSPTALSWPSAIAASRALATPRVFCPRTLRCA